MKDLTTTVFFDMRAPDFGTPTHELYGAALEMAAFADEIGVDRIGLMEHHGSDDSYLPQPFTLVGGMAAVTKNIRFILGAVLLPLHDPVHFKGLTDPKVLRQAGLFAAWTPDELIAHVPSLPDKGNSASSHCWAVFRRRKGGRASSFSRTRCHASRPPSRQRNSRRVRGSNWGRGPYTAHRARRGADGDRHSCRVGPIRRAPPCATGRDGG